MTHFSWQLLTSGCNSVGDKSPTFDQWDAIILPCFLKLDCRLQYNAVVIQILSNQHDIDIRTLVTTKFGICSPWEFEHVPTDRLHFKEWSRFLIRRLLKLIFIICTSCHCSLYRVLWEMGPGAAGEVCLRCLWRRGHQPPRLEVYQRNL